MLNLRPETVPPEKWKKIQEEDEIIVKALGDAGVDVLTFEDLYAKEYGDKRKYLPILAEIYDRGKVKGPMAGAILQFIGNAKPFPQISGFLVEWFKNSENDWIRKWKIARCLAKHANFDDFQDILDLLKRTEYGKAREMLPYALMTTGHPDAEKELVKLLDDQEVNGHIVDALKKSKDPNLIPHIRPFTEDKEDRAWVRKSAKQAVEKLKKLEEKH